MTRAVLFDAGGTLLHVHPSVGEVYSVNAGKFGVTISGNTLNEAFRSAWKRMRPASDGSTPFHTSESIERHWWRGLVQSVFDEACGLDVFNNEFELFFDELYVCFEKPDVWRLYDDVLPALDALDARGLPYAIVSNWDSRLPRLLQAMGIANRFRFILTSAEAGLSKPAAGIFERAAKLFDAHPGDVIHVGDSVEEDALAANAAGMRGVHLSRGVTSSFPDSIGSLIGLADLIG